MRLFFAVWPDAPARTALSRLAREVAQDAQGRAMPDENLHVTLAFLGSVERERVQAALDAGNRASQATAPFDLAFERLGGGSYAITWLSPGRVPGALLALHSSLTTELEAAGFALERRMFRPHLTLVRDGVRRPRRGALPPIAWRVKELALVASTTAPTGAVYREQKAWPLGPP